MLHRRIAAALAALWLLAPLSPALASQGSGCMPNTGTVSGLTLVTDLNAAFAAIISSNSGNTAPATDCSAATVEGQTWVNTTSGQFRPFSIFDGTSSLAFGQYDKTNHIWLAPIGGGEGTLTAAATTDLGSVPQASVVITGNTGITSFGSSAVVGSIHVARFTGTPVITNNNTSLIIPGGNNVTAAAGDVWVAKYEGGGNWRVLSLQLASGAPIAPVPVGTVMPYVGFNPPTGFLMANGQAVSRTTYGTLFATSCVSQSGARVNGSAVITGLASTANLGQGNPVGGTGIGAAAVINTIDSGSQITVSVNSTSTGTNTVDVCPYGIGDGSTTFNVIDLKSRLLVGVDGMGGTALTSRYTFANSGIRIASIGGAGGSQTVSILASHLPGHTHSGTTGTESSTHTHTYTKTDIVVGGVWSNASSNLASSQTSVQTGGQSVNHTHTLSNAACDNCGAGTLAVPPVMVTANYVVKF